jgi:hypothetical protein
MVVLSAAMLAALAPPLLLSWWLRKEKPPGKLIAIAMAALVAFLALWVVDVLELWESMLHDRRGPTTLNFWEYLQ